MNPIDRILKEIKDAGHAVNIESIQKHHPHLYGDIKRSELLHILEPMQSFITTWKVYDNKTLVLPLVPGEPYDFSVEWGDGSGEEKIQLLRGWNADENKSNTGTHVYPEPEVYTVTIKGAIRGFHRRSDYNVTNISLCTESEVSREKGILVYVEQWGLVQFTSCQNMFRGTRHTNVIAACNAPDLRWCTNMSHMFAHDTFFNSNISRWDMSKVTDVSGMFYACRLFNQPIGNWDVSNVTDMNSMLCDCIRFDQPLGDWNVSNVTDMEAMFTGCEVFNQPLKKWDVSNVKTMRYMFSACRSFDQPIGCWDVSKVIHMPYMFQNCVSFNQSLWWDVSNVVNMFSMFRNCVLFNKPIGGWEVNGVLSTESMFSGCRSFKQYIEGWAENQYRDDDGIFDPPVLRYTYGMVRRPPA
jgi:surface protein